jgi:hypothetical protein
MTKVQENRRKLVIDIETVSIDETIEDGALPALSGSIVCLGLLVEQGSSLALVHRVGLRPGDSSSFDVLQEPAWPLSGVESVSGDVRAHGRSVHQRGFSQRCMRNSSTNFLSLVTP